MGMVICSDGVAREYVAEPQPELPEFAFSPHVEHFSRDQWIWREAPEPDTFYVVDVSTERCAYPKPQRKPGEARTLSYTEALHHSLQTKFAPKTDGLLTPYGRSPAFHTMAFPNRHVELGWLAATQRQELATLHETMRTNGLDSVNFSAPSDDGDSEMEAAIAEQDVTRTHLGFGVKGKDEDGRDTYYNLDEVVSIQRQIEWERYIEACGTSLRVFAKITPQGRTITAEYMSPKRVHEPAITTDMLKPHVGTLRRLIGARSNEEVLNDRERAWYYGKLVWARMTPEQQLAWTRRDRRALAYLGIADDNSSRVLFENDADDHEVHQPPETANAEIGLDNPENPNDPTRPLEPSEFDLWPMTDEEFLRGLPEDPGYTTWS